MNQIDENRIFNNLEEVIHWASYLAFSSGAAELTIVPVSPDDFTVADYQTVNIYIQKNKRKKRYTAKFYVYAS